ncbi:MAG: hypothetical protein GY699_09800 [Desulfobacteraceae bacterium]|nr:hypothetical protein [Desulfobacteraceae bacterium]
MTDKIYVEVMVQIGCNIGINMIAKLSQNINTNKQMNAIKVRFILDNIHCDIIF